MPMSSWWADHPKREHAAESVLDCFKRAVRQEFELMDLQCVLRQQK
jgi:hypothetical protein